MRLALALMLCAGPAGAQSLMTPDEFEAWSTGQTLDYWIDGVYWGSERHLEGRRTLDADAEGPCREGRWFPRDGMICFVYVGEAGEHCWYFRRDGGVVVAEIAGDTSGFSSEVVIADQPLQCPGPDVGV